MDKKWYQKPGIGKYISFLYLFIITGLTIIFQVISNLTGNPDWIDDWCYKALVSLVAFYIPLGGGVAIKGIREKDKNKTDETEEKDMP